MKANILIKKVFLTLIATVAFVYLVITLIIYSSYFPNNFVPWSAKPTVIFYGFSAFSIPVSFITTFLIAPLIISLSIKLLFHRLNIKKLSVILLGSSIICFILFFISNLIVSEFQSTIARSILSLAFLLAGVLGFAFLFISFMEKIYNLIQK